MIPEPLKIAIDFDGTLVENEYPQIGKPIIFAFETLKKLEDKGYRLILWTYRCGKPLQEAVSFCEKKGITFYAVNRSYPEEELDTSISRKINADIFIDDRNIGGLVGWGEIHKLLLEDETLPKKKRKNKKGLFSILKR